MKVTCPVCCMCYQQATVEVDEEGLKRWQEGELIQRALPNMSKEDRELLITGTHPECWNKLFPPEPEEGEESE